MAEDNQAPPQLTAVAEKTLPAKCKPGLLAYCPTMDLVALATEDEQLRVFRLNGQQVLGANFGGDPYLDDDEKGEVRMISWKNDGRCSSSFVCFMFVVFLLEGRGPLLKGSLLILFCLLSFFRLFFFGENVATRQPLQ